MQNMNTPVRRAMKGEYFKSRLAQIEKANQERADMPLKKIMTPRQIVAVKAPPKNHPDFCLPTIKILPLEVLRELPNDEGVGAFSGVYFLWLDNELRYIGVSDNVPYRLYEQKWSPGAGQRVVFDRSTYLSIEWPFNHAVELAYIKHYKPACNIRGRGR